MLRTIRAAEIGDLQEGQFGSDIENAIRIAAHDCQKRPAVSKPRVVTIKVHIAPVPDECGDLGSLDIMPKVDTKLPAVSRQAVNARINPKTGEIVWDDLSPDNAHQQTLDTAGDDEN